MRKDRYHIFLSSCYDKDMRVNRGLFRSELLARFNIISGALGINTYLIDFEFGIPYGTSESEVIRICTSEVKKSDCFLCILGNRYGHLVSIESLDDEIIDTIRMLHPSVLSKEAISILEIEILTALRYIPNQCVFFLQSDAAPNEELDSLIKEVISPKQILSHFTSERMLADQAVEQFEQQLSYLSPFGSTAITHNHYRLFSRKLRYYVPDNIQDRITSYIEGNDRRILILTGSSGCGKTTALSKWLVDHSEDGYTINNWFHNLGPNDYVKVVTQMTDESLRTNNEDSYVKDYALRATFEKEYPEKHIFIFDGVNHLCSIDDIEPWITTPNPSVKVIISTNTLSPELINHPDTLVEEMKSVDSATVIRHMMHLEGKQYEYNHLHHILTESLSKHPTNTIILALQQFFREVKYTSVNAPSLFEETWTDSKIQQYLSHLNTPEAVFSAQYQYVCNLASSINLNEICKHVLPLLCYSENGLTSFEISQLVPHGESIIYLFYFLLDNNEKLFVLPNHFQASLLQKSLPFSETTSRKTLLAYFGNRSDSRSKLEEFFQLVRLKQKRDVIRFLSSFINFRTICPESSVYSDDLFALITSKEWRSISHKWYHEFMTNSGLYTVNNMLSICDSLWEAGQLGEAYRIINLVIDHTENSYEADFLRQYHFQAANICDELSDFTAVTHMEKAMSYMEQCKAQLIPLDIIDTYLMAASVYSNALDHSPDAMAAKGYDTQSVINMINLCERETITHLKHFSSLLRNSIHNIAEAYITLGNHELALQNNLKAQNISYQTPNDRASDLYQYSQICISLQNTYDTDLSKAQAAIQECCSIHQTRYQTKQSDDIKADLGYCYNHWGLILNEIGKPMEAVEKLRIAISYESTILNPKSIYRTYCNAGLFCLYSFNQTGNKAYLVEGKIHAKNALCAAKKRTKEGSSESLMDTFDILILLSKLALAERQRLRCQFYLFRAARCLGKSSYRDTLIDIAYNFDFTKKWEVLLLKFTNLFLHSYENIYALDEQEVYLVFEDDA